MKIILISGKAQHGKDTFANFLKEEFTKINKTCRIIHFGDTVKYVAKEYFSWDGEKDVAGRAILQKVGTDIVRANDEHFWTDFVARLAPMLACEYLLIPDWRFEEEHSHLLHYFNYDDIVTVRVNRYELFENFEHFIPYINPKMTSAQLCHRSEMELDEYVTNYIVVNTTLEELAESAQVIAEELTIL